MLVCIDPGHGGDDPGAIGSLNGSRNEKDTNLTASLILGGILNSIGISAVFTRSKDMDVNLPKRVRMANEPPVDLFESIHCNSYTSSLPRGFEVYHYPGSDGGLLLSSMVLGDVGELDWLEIHGGGIKTSDKFYVLKHTSMVAVLMELSYMSNVDDLKLLLDVDNLYELMSVVAKAINTYLISGLR